MLLEWVLIINGGTSTQRFSQKIQALKARKRPVVFPPLIETRTWLRERLIALYEQLVPLRGTVIHDRHFTTTGGTLDVASSNRGKSSKRGKHGNPVSVHHSCPRR